MAKNVFLDWDTTASNNTDIGGIGTQGTNLVSNFDDAFRTLMAQARSGIDGKTVFATKAGDYTALANDNNGFLRFSAAATLSLTAAATLATGWHTDVFANGGIVTVDPNGAETINGAATITIANGQAARIICTGTAFFAIHIPGLTAQNTWSSAQTFSSSITVGAGITSLFDGTVGSILAYGAVDTANAAFMRLRQNATESRLEAGITGTGTYTPITFVAGGLEAGRFDTTGNFFVSRTTVPDYAASTTDGFAVSVDGGIFAGVTNGVVQRLQRSNAGTLTQWYNGTTLSGSIVLGAGTTTYNTTSDYRLKDKVADLASGFSERIDALKPKSFSMHGTATWGFLAHEFASVYPHAVSGDKDAVDDEGRPVYQTMQASTSEVMADLIAEIQSMRKRLAALEDAA